MAKLALVLIFSLTLVLSIKSVVGEDVVSPSQASQLKSGVNDMTNAVSPTTDKAAASAPSKSSSWSDWAKNKLRNYGILSPAAAPGAAPAPSPFARSLGPAPAAKN